MGIEFRLANLFDTDMNRDTHARGYFLAQRIDVFSLLSDDQTGTRRVHCDMRILGRTVDLDTADRRLTQLLLQEVAHLKVRHQKVGVILAVRIPLRRPVGDDTETDTIWINFLTHSSCPLTRQLQ